MSPEDAALKLMGLRLEINPVLSIPFDLKHPFEAGARNRDGSIIIPCRGSYRDLRELQIRMERMNHG